MNILLTGASGFVGGRLAALLRKKYTDKKSHLVLLTSKSRAGYECIEHRNYSFRSEELLGGGRMVMM